MISKQIVDSLFAQFNVSDIASLSIREVGKLVSQIEQQSGVEFIHMEMGVPGLSAVKVGLDAEKQALEMGLANAYPNIEGIQFAKTELSRFAKLFLDIDLSAHSCIACSGGMQGSFAALLTAGRTDASKPYTLFIDPGFPVNKSQLQLLGIPFYSFDILHFRGERLRDKLVSYLEKGNVSTISYSSPNNPSWINLTEAELKIIGELATQYDVIVVEDLAYFGMDFRKNLGVPGEPPYQPTVAHYTDNYVLLISASKIFSYAGQRIGAVLISDKLNARKYSNLKNYFTSDIFGHFLAYGVLYATTAGTSHTAQYAFASMLQAINDGKYNFVENLQSYGIKAKRMKEIFLKQGFYLVYKDLDGDLADGFYFTIAYQGFTSSELMKAFLYYGISAISLGITGSTDPNGLRACVSFVRMDQIPQLEERLVEFTKDINI